ncbi:hypothetical protein C7H19_03435 [Aphanothece hegewaldii CCALA 016]|uniref:DUF3038 domain-containing protein n=2 Tax=Aphanothece TaxID=1121 RepID=A0A2T1M1R8_9CHRO|nr:hypothetical protein C7H19_03435 [Aphanothece hegewaldii CCALA 016]
MPPEVKMPTSARNWEDLPLNTPPDGQHLDNMKAHLDLILMALEALTEISSDGILQAVHALNLEEVIADRVALWRLRQSNPKRKSSGGRKKMDVEEARSLVIIIGYLAQEHRELLRRAVGLLEQMIAQNQEPHQASLLGDYLDNFSQIYQDRLEEGEKVTTQSLTQLAFKLLVDLLFYSSHNGHRRLWLALLDYSIP